LACLLDFQASIKAWTMRLAELDSWMSPRIFTLFKDNVSILFLFKILSTADINTESKLDSKSKVKESMHFLSRRPCRRGSSIKSGPSTSFNSISPLFFVKFMIKFILFPSLKNTHQIPSNRPIIFTNKVRQQSVKFYSLIYQRIFLNRF